MIRSMKNKMILISTVIILSIVLWFSNNTNDKLINFCGSDFLCQSFWFRGVILPFNVSLIYLILSIVLIIILPLSFLKTWLKIIIPFSIIGIIITILTPELCGGMICFDRTLVASGFGKLFLIITLVTVLVKTYLNYCKK